MPACDTCRKRKIRCDRNTPCSNCRVSKFGCTTNLKQPQRTRKIRRSSSPSSLKIIQPRAIGKASTAQWQNKPLAGNTHHLKQTHGAAPVLDSKVTSGTLPDESENAEFEAETPLHTHSVAAKDLLVQTIDNDLHMRNNPRMVAALHSLRQIVDTDRLESPKGKPGLRGLHHTRQHVYELKLPPSDFVLGVLRKSMGRATFIFDSPMAVVSREQFNSLSKSVFFRTEDYPISTAVIVHGTLNSLLRDLKWSETDPVRVSKYDELVQQCRMNLEISISSLDLLLPTGMESAQALVIAALYCMENGQASFCKKLAANGCIMVQSLGWHRSSSMKNDCDVLRRQKLVMFWMLYTLDKNLSLRLGRASLIQDFEIDLPLPWTDPSAPHASLSRINMWVKSARMMGLVYEQLYSPGALRQTDDVRFQTVQQLLKQVEGIRPKPSSKNDITQFIPVGDATLDPITYKIGEVVYRCDEIAYYSLLCVIYRAMPASARLNYDPAAECIKYARSALDCHQKCTIEFKDHSDLWAIYLHWVILNHPFVPFTTIFCHVLTSCNHSDLKMLRQFADSMSDCPAGNPAHKISKLASIFVSIATVYIESMEQQSNDADLDRRKSASLHTQNAIDLSVNQQTANQSMPTWMPFVPFLDAINFSDDPSLNAANTSTMNADLENWFSGTQQIMELLEHDLSYLDSTELPL